MGDYVGNFRCNSADGKWQLEESATEVANGITHLF